MKKEFLIELGIAEDVASKIMAENGKDIQREQNKFSDYEDLKKNLEQTTAELKKFQELKPEEMQTKIADLNAKLEKQEKESAQKLAELENTGRIKDYLSNKKFVNDLTRDAITNKMKESLNADSSKGKSLDDLYGELTKDMQNILVNDDAPKPPVVPQLGDLPNKSADDSKIRAIMGLPEKK